MPSCTFLFFFFNDTATTEIYTLSLHDALPIFGLLQQASALLHSGPRFADKKRGRFQCAQTLDLGAQLDRKSTRLNSSHQIISYAVFCLKKKKTEANGYDDAKSYKIYTICSHAL